MAEMSLHTDLKRTSLLDLYFVWQRGSFYYKAQNCI
jgi:hypothetical protein